MIDRILVITLGILTLAESGLKKLVGKSMWAEVEKKINNKRRIK